MDNLVKEMHDAVLKNTYTGNHAIYYLSAEKKPEYISSSTCTGSFSSSSSATQSPVLGIAFNWKFNKGLIPEAKDFAKWVTSEDSCYSPLFKFLGDGFTVVKDNSGDVHGAVISKDVAFQPMINFFKSARTMTEHAEKLNFWKKWKIQKGKDPRLVYLLMYAYNVRGEKLKTVHAPIENAYVKGFSLKKFMNNGHDFWGLDKDTRIRDKNRTLTGENMRMWGDGKFNVHEIPSAGFVEIKSHFFSLYNKKIPNVLTDEDFEEFFAKVANGEYPIN